MLEAGLEHVRKDAEIFGRDPKALVPKVTVTRAEKGEVRVRKLAQAQTCLPHVCPPCFSFQVVQVLMRTF